MLSHSIFKRYSEKKLEIYENSSNCIQLHEFALLEILLNLLNDFYTSQLKMV